MKYLVPVLAVCGSVLLIAAESRLVEPAAALTAHEWGTFTSVAGDDGMAVTWAPLDGPSDLPCFVHHFEPVKALLSGTVRMETPVIYLYGPEGSTADIRVTFPGGFITEWYPQAKRDGALSASIEWPGVKLGRDSNAIDYPLEQPPSHYYAGRRTDSAALAAGGETEKFLFYRGVGRFQPPVAARVSAGDRIAVRGLGPEPIPASILFENHDGTIAYRVHGPIAAEVTFETPQATADTGILRTEMERILVSQGLFQKEAKAMVATWGDSWFEEGTRLFYFLPTSAVDSVLPLEIRPAPAQVARVFVGRMEIFTPAMKSAIKTAIANGDSRVFAKYGRFLNPVTAGMAQNEWFTERVSAMRQKYLARESACEKGNW